MIWLALFDGYDVISVYFESLLLLTSLRHQSVLNALQKALTLMLDWSHPYVMRTLDVQQVNDKYFLALELVRSRTWVAMQ